MRSDGLDGAGGQAASGQGRACLPGWLSPEQLGEARGVAEELVDRAMRAVRYASRDQCRRRTPMRPIPAGAFREGLVGRLRPLARGLEGEGGVPARVYGVWLLEKPPEELAVADWHRDMDFWPCDDARGWTCWIALDDAPADGGAMRYLPAAPDGGPGSLDALEIAAARAGDLVMHGGAVWHTGGPNATDQWRRVLVVMLGHPAAAARTDVIGQLYAPGQATVV